MNTSLLKKNINNIILSKSNSDINFFVTKKSFLDRNFSCLKDVFIEIKKISEKEFGFRNNKMFSTLKNKDENHLISLDNGILLINSLFKELEKNCLIFFRLKKPILYNSQIGNRENHTDSRYSCKPCRKNYRDDKCHSRSVSNYSLSIRSTKTHL